MYFVYLLECKSGKRKSIYTGITTDVQRRLSEHKTKKGARYTRSCVALKVIYTEEHPSRSAALKREAEIKKMRRIDKLGLSNGHEKS